MQLESDAVPVKDDWLDALTLYVPPGKNATTTLTRREKKQPLLVNHRVLVRDGRSDSSFGCNPRSEGENALARCYHTHGTRAVCVHSVPQTKAELRRRK